MTPKTALMIVGTGVACSVGVVSAGLLSARVLGPLPLSVTQTTTQKASSFDVTGESEIAVVPDNAQVTLGIRVTDAKVANAQQKVNQVMNDLKTKLKALGVDEKDIKTQDYSVYPNYDWSSGTQRTNGYVVSASARVNVRQFDKINDIIDTSTAAGITEAGQVNFTLSDEKEEEVRKQAREEAIEKAKKNAEELAGLAGMRLGKIVNIYENNFGSPVPMLAEERLMNAAGGDMAKEATNISPGQSKYTYSVTLSYETL